MIDPRTITARLLGTIDWQSEVSGYCACPGQALHTHRNAPHDCRINLDGAPTIHCFHSSCSALVAATNLKLRQSLGASPWQIILPGGRVLRSGDVVQASGVILPREVIKAQAHAQGRSSKEQVILESLRVAAERFKPDLFARFRWPYSTILADSPLQVAHRPPDEQFRLWLKIWPAQCHVWTGEVNSTGQPRHAQHFRTPLAWSQTTPMGNFTCGSSFKPGSFSRSNENLNGHRFLVIESDTLPKDQVGAVFAWLNQSLLFTLHAIIDTAGKSLHGWFAAPRSPILAARLKVALVALGCDPKVFTPSQPVRVPGALREGRLQSLIWFTS